MCRLQCVLSSECLSNDYLVVEAMFVMKLNGIDIGIRVKIHLIN